MTDWPHAAWLGTSVLDMLAGSRARPAARRLLGAGLLAAAPALATGVADWSGSARTNCERGAGLVHGAAVASATGIYGLSYMARRRHRHGLGVSLAFFGGTIATFGDYFGGYLALGRGVGAVVTTEERQGGAMDGARTGNRLYRAASGLEGATALDPVAETLHRRVARLIQPGPLKNALTGSWLGHSLHPLLTDFPLGAWMSASLLDLIGGRGARVASERLIAFGLLAALPTAAAGATEWVDTGVGPRRVGVVHAVLNGTAWSLYAASLAARRRQRTELGISLGIGGGVAATISGYLGGHLSLARSVGVSSAGRVELPEQWTPVLRSEEVRAVGVARAAAGEDALLIATDGDELRILALHCTHRGGPLDQGTLDDGCITCPWHGSRFRLQDGAVVRGPASVPEPCGEARERDGWVQVRRRR